MAALVQQDDNLQQPLVNNMAQEVWKCKEAKQSLDEVPPRMGFQPDDRGVMMEVDPGRGPAAGRVGRCFSCGIPKPSRLFASTSTWMLDDGAVQTRKASRSFRPWPTTNCPSRRLIRRSGPPARRKPKAAAPAKPRPLRLPKAAPNRPTGCPPLRPRSRLAQSRSAQGRCRSGQGRGCQGRFHRRRQSQGRSGCQSQGRSRRQSGRPMPKAKAEGRCRSQGGRPMPKPRPRPKLTPKPRPKPTPKPKAEDAAKAKAAEEEDLLALRAQRAKEREEIEAKRAVRTQTVRAR